ncbi:hypothetical protein [Neisseria sp. HMSC075C12]|uniref:hypothetical protein n=1 Tax=Neisseria sp. HMSC075C12 TaxID=1739282 RepID=UPI0024B1A312|nr:hypothetical protein [Neisseria sp. HMSC075C12]
MNTLFIISSIHHLFNAAAFAVFLRHNRKNLHGNFRKMILFQNNDGKLALPCLALPCLALPSSLLKSLQGFLSNLCIGVKSYAI